MSVKKWNQSKSQVSQHQIGVVEVAFAKGRKGHTHMKCIHTYITVLLPVVNLFNGKYDEESGPRDENVCDVLVCEYMCVRMACERARACP